MGCRNEYESRKLETIKEIIKATSFMNKIYLILIKNE